MSAEAATLHRYLAAGSALDEPTGERPLQEILHAIRSHLAMDVAFISEFTGGRRVFRVVDSPRPDQPVKVGAGDPLEESYCQRVVDGRLPELIQDATAVPEALTLPVTRALPVGAHMSVPIRLRDGNVYGTFCCFSFAADPTLNDRDLAMLRAFADLASRQIERDLDAERRRNATERRIEHALTSGGLAIVYQPIYRLDRLAVVGFESLSRFASGSPDVWFNDARRVGKGAELEAHAIERAVVALADLPSDKYVSINVSPDTLLAAGIPALLGRQPLARIVIEVTEHAALAGYEEIMRALQPLRSAGARLAVDDAGAGYASFRHILALKPDLIKLDVSLTRDIDGDSAKRALAIAIVEFAKTTGSRIVAEGIETRGELETLRSLGIGYGQGYVLARPMPLAAAAALCTAPAGEGTTKTSA